jgi:hypothetical protein
MIMTEAGVKKDEKKVKESDYDRAKKWLQSQAHKLAPMLEKIAEPKDRQSFIMQTYRSYLAESSTKKDSSDSDRADELARQNYSPSGITCAQYKEWMDDFKKEFDSWVKRYHSLELTLNSFKEIDLMRYTGHGQVALDEGAKKINTLWAACGNVYGAGVNLSAKIAASAIFSEDGGARPAPQDLDIERVALEARAELGREQANAELNVIEGELKKALRYESLKTLIRDGKLKPGTAIEGIRKGRTAADQLVNGLNFAAGFIPEGTATKAVQSGLRVVAVLKDFIGRQAEALATDQLIKEIMADEARAAEAIRLLGDPQNRMAAANYLKNKYMEDVNDALTRFDLVETVGAAALHAAIVAGTHGGGVAVTKALDLAIDSAWAIIRLSIRGFCEGIKDAEIELALEKANPEAAVEREFADYLMGLGAKVVANAKDKVKNDLLSHLVTTSAVPTGLLENAAENLIQLAVGEFAQWADIKPAQHFGEEEFAKAMGKLTGPVPRTP